MSRATTFDEDATRSSGPSDRELIKELQIIGRAI